MRRPNLFIVGAPKCGTTALGTYLESHPRVCFSPVKEPNHFAPDIMPGSRFRDRSEYLRLFAGATDEHVAIGEATPFYLRSHRAVPDILDAFPDAKLVVMLRNPIEAAHAFHSTHLRWGLEVVGSFEEAWRLQDRRAAGEQVPPWCPSLPVLQYGWFYRLGEQAQRLLELAPRRQVHFVVFDDLVRDAAAVYGDVLRFLGIPDDRRTDFPKVNANREYRAHFLRTLDVYLRKSPLVRRRKDLVKRIAGIESFGLHRLLHDLNQTANMRVAPRRPLAGPVARELRCHFASDVAKLSGILGRDLSHWLKAEPGAPAAGDHAMTAGGRQAAERRAGL